MRLSHYCSIVLGTAELAKEFPINTAVKLRELLYKMFMGKSKERIKSSICLSQSKVIDPFIGS